MNEKVLTPLGIVVSVVIPSVIQATIENLPLWVTAVIAVTVLASFLFLQYALQQRSKRRTEQHLLGVAGVYDSFSAARSDIFEAITEAKKRVVLVGISHRSYINDDEFLRALKRFLSTRKACVRFYFLAIGSEVLRERAEYEKISSTTFVKHIEGSRQFLRDWATKEDLDGCVEVESYDDYPVWRLLALDDDLIFASVYPLGHQGTESFVMRLVDTGQVGDLFSAFSLILARLERSTAVASAHDGG